MGGTEDLAALYDASYRRLVIQLFAICGDPPPTVSAYVGLTGTPDGGLLAMRSWPRTKIWRADDLDTDDFSLVYDAGPGPENYGGGDEVFVGDEIRIIDAAATVISSDQGRTWTNVSTWR